MCAACAGKMTVNKLIGHAAQHVSVSVCVLCMWTPCVSFYFD